MEYPDDSTQDRRERLAEFWGEQAQKRIEAFGQRFAASPPTVEASERTAAALARFNDKLARTPVSEHEALFDRLARGQLWIREWAGDWPETLSAAE